MWTKLSHALKPKQESELDEHQHASTVYNHPNPSTVSTSSCPFPAPSPPASPSKMGRRGIFKRLSKTPKLEGLDLSPDAAGAWSSPLPLRIPGLFPKKMKSSLNMNENASEASLTRPSEDYQQILAPPLTPAFDGKFPSGSGSVRSILRDPQTPGTGQNVRFFSREAYKVASPEPSTSSATDNMSFLDRLEKTSPDQSASGPLLESPASSPSVHSLPQSPNPLLSFGPIPPPEISNFFDLPRNHDLPPIPTDTYRTDGASISKLEEDSNHPVVSMETSTPYRGMATISTMSPGSPENEEVERTIFHSMEQSRDSPHGRASTSTASDRNKSISFGQSVLQSMAKALPSPVDSERSKASSSSSNRSRALSDSAFRTLARPESDRESSRHGYSDSNSSLGPMPTTPEQPDPFRANATTYYTPQTLIPTTPPPTTHKYGHSQKPSDASENSVILSLRTQLALQQELAVHYEVDLQARDEVVDALTAKLDAAEREGERRRGIIGRWKRKVGELEKFVRSLEEEVDRSREESFNRSVMDEASGEALRCLQGRIGVLEREKADVEKKGESTREANEKLKEEVKMMKERERTLREGMESVKEQMELMGSASASVSAAHQADNIDGELRVLIVNRERENAEETDRHRKVEFAWQEERACMATRLDELDAQKAQVFDKLAAARATVEAQETELRVLKAEVESQWKNTEVTSEKIEKLEHERDVLKKELDAFENRVSGMSIEWADAENRRVEMETELNEAWARKEDAEKEREQLAEELKAERDHSEQLTIALQERDAQVTLLEQERQYASDNVSRLEQIIRARDTEIAECTKRVVEREREAETLREEMSALNRDHRHVVDEHARALRDAQRRQEDIRVQLEETVKARAEGGVVLDGLKERSSVLKEELERLRRQVHDLQQESADKEVKIVQLTKMKDQNEEDKRGLNIALDSKQQELELIKRKIGVRGTAGSTPAPPSRILKGRESGFATPITSRPPSALSDSGKDTLQDRKSVETPLTAIKAGPSAFGKSTRVNGTITTSSSVLGSSVTKPIRNIEGSMGPPPPKARLSMVTAPSSTQIRTPSATLSRSSSARPSQTSTAPVHRRVSSALEQSSSSSRSKIRREGSIASTVSEQDEEKENSKPASNLRRTTMVPA